MDISLERDSTAIGSIFQQIINDMKNSSPLWEDFIAKASKLYSCLRATIQAIAAYLDAFQKIADAATNSRGATKEIGTALTRVCLRHKAVETRMKSFTTAIMDCLIIPLQDKLEDWKRQVALIDKDHAKEHKRCRSELKKRSSDTLRLQKKAKKGQSDTIQSLVESSMQDITQRRAELEDVERKSLRAVMIEERVRYCTFVNMLQPVVKEECDVMYELGHLQEAMDSIAIVTKEPNVLPQSSEELILESKMSINLYPESPGGSNSHGCSNSLGSRKSSVCSISSMNSSGSSGSPGHQYQRSLSQLISPAIRLKPGESSDSGFCSSSALTSQTSASISTNPTHAVSTWPPPSQDITSTADRPHTISSAYEKGHQRPALTVFTFQNPDGITEAQKSPANIGCRPPLPIRCSSLERPLSSSAKNSNVQLARQCPSPIPAHVAKEHPIFQPTYVNMSELASMAASKITNHTSSNQQTLIQQQQQHQTQHQQLQQSDNSPVQSIASSLISSDSSATNHHSSPDISADTSMSQNNSPQTNESLPQTPIASSSAIVSDEINIHQLTGIVNELTNESVSPDDIKSVGSVLEKLSIFEKLEQKQTNQNNIIIQTTAKPPDPIFTRKNEEIYTASTSTLDKDSDQLYEDSIQQLNILIGELDSFQKEHETKNGLTDGASKTTMKTTTTSTTKDCENSNCDKISIDSSNFGSINYSLHSNCSSDYNKFSFNDSDIRNYKTENNVVNNLMNSKDSEMIHHIPNEINTTINDLNQSSEQYVKENVEIVVLRRKDQNSMFADMTNPNDCYNNQLQQQQQQRFSSFKNDFICTNRNDDNSLTSLNHVKNYEMVMVPNNTDDSNICKTNAIEKMSPSSSSSNKPLVSPRPTSLSGCISRITRRSSVNSTKPPPPVRRSSSVTPNHQLGLPNSPSLSQQNLMNTSSESLPPPPAYLLDSSGRTSPGKVGETIKALTEIRHMPASPGVIRRAQALAQMNQASPVQNTEYSQNTLSTCKSEINSLVTTNNTTTTTYTTPHSSSSHNLSNINDNFKNATCKTSSAGIYAQPKQVTKMSSFRNPSPSSVAKQQNANLINQLNARLAPNSNKKADNQKSTTNTDGKIYAQSQSSQQLFQIYDSRNNLAQHHVQQQQQQQQPQPHHHHHHQQQQHQPQLRNDHNQKQQRQINRHQQQQQPMITSQSHSQHQMQNQTFKNPSAAQQQKQFNDANYSTKTVDRNYHYQQQLQHHHQQQQQQQQQHCQQQHQQTIDGKNQIYVTQPHHHHHHIHQKIYVSTNPFITTTQTTHYPPNSFGKDPGLYSPNSNYAAANNDKSTVRAKSKVGFLENLNAKLAEQRMSGKAFAVRNLINSKALPDPRVCHESLMDQIKRGATLKRNKSINDRSAPKIH